jgi:Amt family ammonium transporter
MLGRRRYIWLVVSVMSLPTHAINSGDTAWLLAASSLVMIMTPAVGLFYGGMVRRKNLLSTIMLSFSALVVITLQWLLFGYSMAFGPDIAHVIGSLEWFAIHHVGFAPNPDYAKTIPHLLYMLFQMKFAIITPALISGAFVERIRYSTFLIFILLWSTIVYVPMAHWIWGMGGWLRNLGALDFAGGTVVHITAGISALAIAMVIRPRIGFGTDNEPSDTPGSVTLTLLGGVLLWFGWFGFNGGSALAADGLSVLAIINTNAATAAAALVWMLLSSLKGGRPTIVGITTGVVVGLVAITPACGYVDILSSILIGAVASVISFYCMKIRVKHLKIDETLDVWACHGMAGTWGAIATGIFANVGVNPNGANGLLYGNLNLFNAQCISVLVAWVYSFAATYVIAWTLNQFRSLSVSEHHEELGLDRSQHGEEAYAMF